MGGAEPRIEVNPRIMLGKPVIRGTRVTVELILRKLSEGATERDLLDAYPHLAGTDVRAALAYAADTLAHEVVLLTAAGGVDHSQAGMRFLADESCDFAVVRALREAGHDVLAVADVARGAEDPVVVDFARNEGRVLITEDKDFGGLVYAALGDAATGGVILVRFPSTARSVLGAAVREAIDRLGATLEGQFVVVEPGRVRVGRGRRT